jgi:hypothetical protein
MMHAIRKAMMRRWHESNGVLAAMCLLKYKALAAGMPRTAARYERAMRRKLRDDEKLLRLVESYRVH